MQDSEIIKRMKEGDLEALGELYNRYHRMVYQNAYIITGDAETASDLSQDVFLRLYRFAKNVDTERPIQPWLYRMTANLAYTWIKRNRLKPRILDAMAGWIQFSRKQTPHEVTEHKEEWERVEKAISSLPVAQRLVVVMYYLNDLSLQEISEALEIPVGTVKSRLHSARIALKKELGLISDDGDQRLPEFNFEST